jgi:hypothetical protein
VAGGGFEGAKPGERGQGSFHGQVLGQVRH